MLHKIPWNLSLCCPSPMSLQTPLRCRHDGHDSVSNHQPHHCLHNRLFGYRSKKTSKLRVTGLCADNSPGTGNSENVSIWWRHHASVILTCRMLFKQFHGTLQVFLRRFLTNFNFMKSHRSCYKRSNQHKTYIPNRFKKMLTISLENETKNIENFSVIWKTFVADLYCFSS